MTVRPDGGWGWIIAIASFLINTIVDGVKYSFGIMFVELVDAFQRSKSETSWTMSIQIGILFLTGPIIAAFVNRFGCRTVALVGTLLSFVGFLSSAFVNSLHLLYLTFGLVAGLGFGMLSLPTVVMLAHYFDKRLAFASGIAAMGSGAGTLIFNPLSKFLIDNYTWRGTFLINSAIVLNGLTCALVMRSPDKTMTVLVDDCHDNKSQSTTVIEPTVGSSKHFKQMNDDVHVNVNETQRESEVTEYLLEGKIADNAKTGTFNKEEEREINSSKAANVPLLHKESTILGNYQDCVGGRDIKDGRGRYVYVETELDIDHSENVRPNPRRRKSATMTDNETLLTERKLVNQNKMSSKNLDNDTGAIADCDIDLYKNQTNSESQDTKRWISFAALKNPGFLLYLIAEVLIQLSLNTPFTFLPDMMLYKGFQTQDAVWILFITGVVSTVSRVVIGLIADLPFVNRLKLCNTIVVLNGLVIIACPFCSNYASFVVYAVAFGFFTGSSSSLRYVLIPDLFGIEMIADLCGITMFFSGIAALVGLPKSGALFDATGNYVIPFIVSGVELTLSGILLFLIPSVQKKF